MALVEGLLQRIGDARRIARLAQLARQAIGLLALGPIAAGLVLRRPLLALHVVARLVALAQSVAHTPKTRRPTRPTHGSQKRRLEAKSQRGDIKAGRGKVRVD